MTSASQMNENFQALKAELEAQRALIEANLGNQKWFFRVFSSINGGQGLLAMQQACHNLVAGSHVRILKSLYRLIIQCAKFEGPPG